ncbi:MAG: hypothetical protein JWL87_10, partial [Candidatus Adlerbacteria bacterium]|nr:hypothetical protein [Candidatus Adlerbacteria bacterium]
MKGLLRLLLVVALVAPSLSAAQAQTATKTPPPTCRLSANAERVGYNTKVRLDWATTQATSG